MPDLPPGPTAVPPGSAGRVPGDRRHHPPAELRADRRSERATASAAAPRRDAPGDLHGINLTGKPLARSTGFAIHQLLTAMPELRGPPPGLAQTITAYRTHLAGRIHYAGPVSPVDLRI